MPAPHRNVFALTRRQVLGMLGSIAATGGLSGCGSCKPPVLPSQLAAAVDVHCHVFNARDLPIRGFVEDVVLQEPPHADIPLDAFITLVAAVMDAGAISAADEANELRGGRLRRLAAGVPTFEQDRALVRQRVEDAVRRMQSMGTRPLPDTRLERLLPRAVAPTTMQQDNIELFRRLAARAPAPAAPQPRREEELRPGVVTPEEVARGVVSVEDDVFGTLYMATLLTLPRADLVERLARLPDQDDAEVRFFAPAMVDYSYWLGDFDVSSLSDQVEVMSAIAALPNRSYAVHGWVSFCPWRQIVEPQQMAIVQDAVRSRGLVGVKLYPLMGFYPIGNEGAPDADTFPERLQAIPDFGRRLDDALRALYDWCVSEDVPLLAHTSHSQYPTAAAGLRGSPTAWRRVLSTPQYRTLRLNFGHLGGLWSLASDDRAVNLGWTEEVVRILADPDFAHAYADVSDYSLVLERDGSEAAEDEVVLDRLNELLDRAPDARRKLMYGTDWVMLARTLGVQEYYPHMKSIVPARLHLSDSETRGFLGINAAHYLGLAVSNGNTPMTRQRLERFYDVHGLNKELLRQFDSDVANPSA